MLRSCIILLSHVIYDFVVLCPKSAALTAHNKTPIWRYTYKCHGMSNVTFQLSLVAVSVTSEEVISSKQASVATLNLTLSRFLVYTRRIISFQETRISRCRQYRLTLLYWTRMNGSSSNTSTLCDAWNSYYVVGQRVQNTLAKPVLGLCKFDSATLPLTELHWLPIAQRHVQNRDIDVHTCQSQYLLKLLNRYTCLRDSVAPHRSSYCKHGAANANCYSPACVP